MREDQHETSEQKADMIQVFIQYSKLLAKLLERKDLLSLIVCRFLPDACLQLLAQPFAGHLAGFEATMTQDPAPKFVSKKRSAL